uniref:Carboxylesterase type B domain-containing protein n=1 Tax=Anopheles farauti TaxID=69004 RepID=A0A182QPF3_9DIPT
MANDRWPSAKCRLLVVVSITLTLLVTLAVTLSSNGATGLPDSATTVDDAPSPDCIVTFDRKHLAIGTRRLTYGGRAYCAYEGIPYVLPPVGKLRFEDPRPYQFEGSWLFRNVSKACPQAYPATTDKLDETGEDCLYLNVYTRLPRGDDSTATRWPVLVWIHGGSFVVGSSQTDIFGPEFLIDKVGVIGENGTLNCVEYYA